MKNNKVVIAVMPEPKAGFELREIEVPEPKNGEVLVEIVQTNICGSDLHLYRGEMARGFPKNVILGHEILGRIVQIGQDAHLDSEGVPLEVGDLITYRYFEPCFHCKSCSKGNYHECLTSLASVLRDASTKPYLVGGFASHYLVTRNRTRFKVPAHLNAKSVSLVSCALAQVIYRISQSGLTLNNSVVMQGCGGLGLLAVALASMLKAFPIIAIDNFESRLALAKEFGATHLISAQEHADKRERTERC